MRSVVRDWQRDWQRWTSVERRLATVFAALLAFAVPAGLLLSGN